MALYTFTPISASWSSTCRFARKDFEAYNDKDAIHLALYYCNQRGEDFIKVEGRKDFVPFTLCLCRIDKSNLPSFYF